MRDTVVVPEPVSTVGRGPWRALSSRGSKVALKKASGIAPAAFDAVIMGPVPLSSRPSRSVMNGSWSRPDNRFDGVEGPFSRPQQTSEQLPPDLGECLHSGDANGAWNDRLGRETDAAVARQTTGFGIGEKRSGGACLGRMRRFRPSNPTAERWAGGRPRTIVGLRRGEQPHQSKRIRCVPPD